MLELQPINWDEACIFIAQHHRHHLPSQGWKFGIAVNASCLQPGYQESERAVVGVITIGRPVARRLDNGVTLEVTRCCTDGTKNAASMLYGAAWRACKALGYKRLVTYTLESETGTSLVAAGWRSLYTTPGASWSVPSRPRVDTHPLGQRTLWEVV